MLQVSSGFELNRLSLVNSISVTALTSVASTRVQGWGDEPCEPTVRLPDWSELVAPYSRMKSAWGWANGGRPILVCCIRKYVIILGGYSRWRPPNQNIGGWGRWKRETGKRGTKSHEWNSRDWKTHDQISRVENARPPSIEREMDKYKVERNII